MAHGTLVDTNVLLDVITEDPAWMAWSSNALIEATESGPLFINPIIYGETSAGYDTIEELDRVLPKEDFRRLALPWEAAFLAAKVYLAYRRSGGTRSSALPDFFIGAHAAVEGLPILTRDPRHYRTYFPTLTLHAPD